jgi:hypothetical protein
LSIHCGCVDAVQVEDKDEIPTTIGSPQDSAPSKAATASPLENDGLESSQPPKQDLATLLRKENEEFEKQTIEIPKTWTRMSEENHIWADKENKRVIVRGAVCIQEGLLEMFACPRDTKEHEAVVSVHAKASEIHAILLALKINPGQPMVWGEEYYPAHGPIMNIEVSWTDASGKLIKRRAQDMIRNTDTAKAMACDFVFGGSSQSYDPYEKRDKYFADDGPMINVANQPDAMIDVSIKSSEAERGSLFEAFTENVPPVNTKVYIAISATDRKVDAKEGKPTVEQLRKEDEIRRAAMEKRWEELDKARDEAEAKAKAEKES